MITTLRKSFQTKVYKIVLWITLLAVGGVFSIVEVARTFFKARNQWVIQINSEKIDQPDYIRNVMDQEERLRLLRSQYGEYADVYFQMLGVKPVPQELALDALIHKTLLNQAARKLALPVGSEMIQEKLHDIVFTYQELSDFVPLFVWDMSVGDINTVLLRNYLQKMGLTLADLDAHAVLAIRRQTLNRLVEMGGSISDLELKERFMQTVGHKFSILTLQGSDILAEAKKEAVSDETLKAFFEAQNNQSRRYYVPEKRTAHVVTFTPEVYGIDVASADIETYYNNHKAEYIEKPTQVQVRHISMVVTEGNRTDVEQKMREIRQQLLADPASFSSLARQHSHDKTSANQGGLLPFFAKGQKDPAFERASFLLPKGGDISEVITTKDGVELIQLVERKLPVFKSLATVSPEIRKLLLKRKFNEQVTHDIRLMQPASDTELASFIAKKHGKVTTVSDLPYNDSVLARSLFKLAKGERTSYYEGENAVLVSLTAVHESYTPTFESLKNEVKQDYYAQNAGVLMKKTLERLANQAHAQALQSLQKETKIEHTEWLSPTDTAPLESLKKRGVDTNKIFQMENVGSVFFYERNGNGYLIRLDGLKPFSDKEFEAKKEALRTTFMREKNGLFSAGFIASLYRSATIVKNLSELPLVS